MKRQKPLCILFAGPVGSSKTPIANYLSFKLDLPVFNNDAVRNEVIEDVGALNEEEYLKRRDKRLEMILRNKTSFIYDASIDREWKRLKEALEKLGYDWFIISLDLSKKFLLKLYGLKGYKESSQRLDELIKDHELFIAQYGQEVNLHINDKDFIGRLGMSYKKSNEWINK